MANNIKLVSPDRILEKTKVNKEGIKNIVNFAKEYDFTISIFKENKEFENNLVHSDNIQGYVVVNDEQREIGVYHRLPYPTKKFIIIYLLSSYILNGNDELFADIIYNESIYDRKIYDYALELLMPDEYFKKLLDMFGEDIERLVKEYNLSKIVVEEKIKKLKKEK